ncbi:MAG: SEC-C metal-binding domain-containing protein, partial [Polyangiaceae bacterium]
MDLQLSPSTSTPSAFDDLRQTGETLADELRTRILALGAAAIPPLVALVEDDDAAAEEAPGEGWPPIHAVDLLADLRAEEAIAPMLRALRGGDMDDILSSRIAVRLPVFGAAALEPVLAELSGVRDTDRAVTLCAILANLGVKDERVWMALSECFHEVPSLSSGFLATYGDDRALPLIEREIFAFDGESPSSLAHFDLELLVEAYEELAGELPELLAARVDYLFERQSLPVALADSPPPAVSTKVGRNEPCPCGSGKK